MAVGVERRARKAASRLENALLFRPLQSNAMSYNPLPRTTGISLPVTEPVSLRNTADRLDFDPTVPGQAGQAIAPSVQSQANEKRRPSKGKVPEIRRSSSTPHMRNLALATSGELSPTAEKRRNKLGYHRTSVACGHCRRRKIRCLLAPDDPQGRCQNCIRLKKECNFYPVEQNPENQRSHTTSAKETGSGAANSSTTSSPRQPPPVPTSEKIEEYRPSFSSTTPTSRFGVQPDGEVDPTQVPHSSGINFNHPTYNYPPSIDTQWSTPGFLPSSTVAESSPSSTGYWRPSPSTANSNYGSESNMSGGQTPATMSTTSIPSYGGPHDAWGQPGLQPPTRSMSYGNIEGLPQQYAGLGIQQQPEHRGRNSPYYPTTLDTNPATLHSTTIGDASSGPLSAPIMANPQYGYPQTWNPYTIHSAGAEMPMQGRSMSAQWYAEPTQLDQVQEEGAPPMTYSHHGMPQFYSGA